jgi:hypothetical protein
VPDESAATPEPENPGSIKHTHKLVRQQREKTDAGYASVWGCAHPGCPYTMAMRTDDRGRLVLHD